MMDKEGNHLYIDDERYFYIRQRTEKYKPKKGKKKTYVPRQTFTHSVDIEWIVLFHCSKMMIRIFLQLFLLVNITIMVTGFLLSKKLRSPVTYEMKQKLLTIGTSSYTVKDNRGLPVYKVCFLLLF